MKLALIITRVLTFIGIIFFLAWFIDKKRSEALQLIAKALSFSFERKGDESLIAMYDNFDLLSKGHAKKASNVMHGRSGDMDITIMDYQYTIGHGKNSSTHPDTLVPKLTCSIPHCNRKNSEIALPFATLRLSLCAK